MRFGRFLFVTVTIVFVCLFFVSAGNRSEQLQDSISRRPLETAFSDTRWITYPSGGSITVVGIADRKRNREEAIHNALLDAACRISLYYGVYGESLTLLNQGSSSMDYFVNTSYSLTIRNNAESYVNALIFDKDVDVWEKNGTVFVRARYAGVPAISAPITELHNGIPRWVRDGHADLPGYLVGVGIAKNKGSLQKTYQASWENAIVSILSGLSVNVDDSVIDTDTHGRFNQNSSISRGSVNKVMILETWIDRKTNTVWTLLVAKE